MKFLPCDGGIWHLIDETASPNANLIAILRGPVEILAMKTFCEAMLRPEGLSAAFSFQHDGRSYRVTPYRDRGDRLSLRIAGDDGSLGRVETEFGWPSG